MPSWPFVLLWSLALLLAAGLGTAASIRYAHWRGMFDHEGRRRSHRGAVPRGGGIAIALTWILACGLLGHGQWLEPALLWRLAGSVALVAAIGWLDDHRPQPVWSRLAVHAVAAGLLLGDGLGLGLLMIALAFVGAIALVNVWNFMDGINGMAGLQAAFVGTLLADAFAQAGQPGLLLLALALVVAVLGFLPFNFPRARCFLGDVGSGGLGMAVAALLIVAVANGALDPCSALLLPIVFLVDAGLTLASRIMLGRRWYTAHREHLYQWLVRRGRSHAEVSGLYAGFNLAVVLPAWLLVAGGHVPPAVALAAVATLAVAGWFTARHWVLRSARHCGIG